MKAVRRKVVSKRTKSNNIPIEPKFAEKNFEALLQDFFPHKKPKNDRDRSVYKHELLVKPVIIADSISYPKTIKNSIYNLITYTKNKFKLPKDCECNINLIYAMRCATSQFGPPDARTVMRLILNYNNNDLYQMETAIPISEKSNANLGLAERKLYMLANTLTGLGPAQLCSYNTIIHGNPKFKIPTVDGNERMTIKPRNYNRLTVVMDFYISKEFARDLDKHLKSLGDENGPNRKYIMIVKDVLTKMIQQYL